MRQPTYEVITASPWRKAKYAMDFFQVSRYQLERLASLAGARRKIGNSVLYNIKLIDEFLSNLDI